MGLTIIGKDKILGKLFKSGKGNGSLNLVIPKQFALELDLDADSRVEIFLNRVSNLLEISKAVGVVGTFKDLDIPKKTIKKINKNIDKPRKITDLKFKGNWKDFKNKKS